MMISTERKYKKKQTEILELKNEITKLKNSLEGFNHRLDEAEERISKPEHRLFEIIQSQEQEEKIMNKKKV